MVLVVLAEKVMMIVTTIVATMMARIRRTRYVTTVMAKGWDEVKREPTTEILAGPRGKRPVAGTFV
jgi:hypothetical protein